ncbi:MAG: LacI family DNA-binding transcriptional regulator [Ktedonobacteraceae bacterium]|nr:LacI family DNA-binding transcriptional regulator [Ktedonobacteraceae bacterium]MBV9615128.1 LacI family DNA-binding transcriptional regulator [Ktedonobacteraceae bacterium]
MKPSVTISDVAKASGVSIQTVSRVINNKNEISSATRQRVLQTIEELGYRPNNIARGLVTSRTFTLGLVMPDIANPFFPEIARGAEEVALEHGYTIFLCNTNEQPERELVMLNMLESQRVAGIVVCGARLPDEQLLPVLRRFEAVVLINRKVPLDIASSVLVDYAEGTRMAIAHLQANKRQRIGFLSGPGYTYGCQTRLDAFTQMLQTDGQLLDHSLLQPCAPNSEGGYLATRELLARHPDLDGLLCYNDLVATGALQACAELGVRVPEQLAMVGYDDIPVASVVTPALTTVGISKTLLGAHAMRLLLKQLNGEQTGKELLFSPQLIVRVSAP